MTTPYVISVATAGDKAIAGPLTVAALVLDTRIASPRFVWTSAGALRQMTLAEFDAAPTNRRDMVSDWLRQRAAGYSVLTCTVDQLNSEDPRVVRRCTLGRAVFRAVEHALFRDPSFCMSPDRTRVVLSGGDTVPVTYVRTIPQESYRDRAGRPWQIDAAYAVARSYRDVLMLEADKLHPDYQFALNYGYASGAHRAALETKGLTPEHRVTSPLVREIEASR